MVTKKTICSKHGHLLDESNASHSCSPRVCGANLPMQHTIGDEYTWTSEGMAGLLSQEGVGVKEVTTVQDSGAGRAGESLFKDGLLANLPNLKTQKKSIKIEDKLFHIMPKGTKSEKTKLLGNFALDAVNKFSIQLNVNLSPPNYFIIPNSKKKHLPAFENLIQGLS